MKTIILLSLLVLSSCSLVSRNVSETELSYYSYKHYDAIKRYSNQKVDSHTEITKSEREKLKKILNDGIDRSRELKIRESKLSQLLIDALMKKKPNKQELARVKSDVRKLYREKSDNFFSTVDGIKKVLGVKYNQEEIMRDINPYIYR